MSDEASPPRSDEVAGGGEATEGAQPLFRIVNGTMSAEELAALVTVISARNAAAAKAAARSKPHVRSAWGHPASLVRKPHRHGPDQWRRSAWA